MQSLRIRILCARSVGVVACRGPTLQRWFSQQRIPVQSLQDKASKWSGVATADAIDNGNLFEKLGGTTQPFIDLYTNFYTRSVRSIVPLLHHDSIRPDWFFFF
jgi:hypothetical protein